jgi:hypothetical protein
MLGVLLISYDQETKKLSVQLNYFKPHYTQINGYIILENYFATNCNDIKTDVSDKIITFSFINTSNFNTSYLDSPIKLINGLELKSPKTLSTYIDVFDAPLVIITAQINYSGIQFNTTQSLYSPFTNMGFLPCPVPEVINTSGVSVLNLVNTAQYADIIDRGIGKF